MIVSFLDEVGEFKITKGFDGPDMEPGKADPDIIGELDDDCWNEYYIKEELQTIER